MSVAKDVYVVAGIDIEDGKAGKVAYGAMFGYTGYPFDNIEVARVGGDADEQAALSQMMVSGNSACPLTTWSV